MTAPAARSDIRALHDDAVRHVFPNGLVLLVRRDPSAPVASVVTWVDAGYLDEGDDVVGISHVLEHMYFKGTPTRGVGAIARETKGHGGWLNAHTIYDHTAYYTVVPSDAWTQALEIQFDAWHRSVIDDGELARELEVIIQEASRKRDNPSAVAVETLFALLHDAHRLRRWRIGEPAQLRTFTRAMVRGFYERWYVPSNTIVAIAGDVDVDAVIREVGARHGAVPDTRTVHVPGPVETAAPGFRAREETGDIAHAHLAIGWRAPGSAHTDAPLLDLGAAVLSAGRASRLYRAVRERELALGVTAWHQTARDTGVFVLHAEAHADRAGEALDATWREVQALRRDGPQAHELARAQQVLEARWLRRAETVDGQAMWLASWESEARLAGDASGADTAARYVDRLLGATPLDVQETLARWLAPGDAAVFAYRPAASATLVSDALTARLAAASGHAALGADAAPPAAPAVHIADRPALEAVEHGVHRFRTAHDVPILVVPRPGALLANIAVVVRGGTCAEPDGADGLARLTAHAMIKGAGAHDADALAARAEALGGSIGVAAGLESGGWSLSVPAAHLGEAVSLVADVVQRPHLAADAVRTERTLATQEAARVRDDMYRWPLRLATAAAHAGHPYARSVLGTADTLASLDADAVRAFHARHVREGAAVIGLAGDGDPRDLAAFAARAFDVLAWRDDAPPAAPAWPTAPQLVAESREKQQTALALLFPSPGRGDDARFTARVLSAIASGLGGRFFEELRDRRSLAYTVAAFAVERRFGGTFATYIATDPAREEEARTGMVAEIARLAADPVSDEELARAHRYLVGAHAIARQSGASVLAEVLDAWLFGAGLHEPTEFAARVERVTAADVQRYAATWLDPARVVEGIVRGTAGPV